LSHVDFSWAGLTRLLRGRRSGDDRGEGRSGEVSQYFYY